MAPIPGSVPVAGFFAPTDDTDTYAVTDPKWGKGGFSNWDSLSDILNIPAGRRELGMVVSVPTSELVSGADGITLLKLINNPSTDYTQRTDWEDVFSSKSVYVGDLDVYVDNNGSDETGDGSQANPYKTIKFAYDSLPDVVKGKVYIRVGSGNYDLPDLDSLKVCDTLYIYGHTTNLNHDVNFDRPANYTSYYEYHADSDFDYERKLLVNTSNSIYNVPVISYDSATQIIRVANPSESKVTNYVYETHSMDTNLTITEDLNINVYSIRLYIKWFNINVGSTPFKLNSKYYYHTDLFIDSCYIDQTQSIRLIGNIRYTVLFNSSSNRYGLYTPLARVRNTFYYGLALVSTASSSKAGMQVIGPVFSNIYIEGYKYGLELMSHSAYKSGYVDSYWNYYLDFQNVENAIYIKSEDIYVNFENSTFFNNVDNLLYIPNEEFLRGLYVRLNGFDGTYPTNTLNASFDEYKLYDEQVVNKVVLPDKSSSPVLELTTTERNNLSTVYEGRVVKDTDDSELYIFKNGSWEAISGGSSAPTFYDADGVLTSDRTVDAADQSLVFENLSFYNFKGGDGDYYFDFNGDYETVQYRVVSIPDDASSSFYMSWEGIEFRFTEGGNSSSIEMFSSGMRVRDDLNSKGLYYASDYSANFTDRSLVDKGYVDSAVSNASISKVVDSDGDTYVSVEETADDDIVHVVTNGKEVLKAWQEHTDYNKVVLGDVDSSGNNTVVTIDDYYRSVFVEARTVRVGDLSGSYNGLFFEIDSTGSDFAFRNGSLNVPEGGLKLNIIEISSSAYYLTTNHTVLANASSNSVDLRLPSASANKGKYFYLKAIDLTNPVTITPQSGDTINGSSSFTFTSSGEVVVVQSDGGTNWEFMYNLAVTPVDEKVKVSSNDSNAGYLSEKIVGTINKIIVTELNDGSDEDLQVTIGSDVFDVTVNDLDDVSDGSTYGKVKNDSLTSNEVDHTKILNIGTNSHADIDNHIASTSNPHSVTFTQAVDADANTDITAGEAETLTDGSNADSLHKHSLVNLDDVNTTGSATGDILFNKAGVWTSSDYMTVDEADQSLRNNVPVRNMNQYLQIYDSTGGLSISTTEQPIVFDSLLIADDLYDFTASNSRVKVYKSGYYKINYSIGIHNTSSGWGSGSNNVKAWLRINGSSNVKYSTSYSYQYDDYDPYSTNANSVIVKLSASDYVELLVQEVGSDYGSETIGDEVQLNMEFLR